MSPDALREMLSRSTVSPFQEMVAFELLYSDEGSSLKKITEATVKAGKLPSQAARDRFGMFLPDIEAEIEELLSTKLGPLSVAINNTPAWPKKLADSERPTPLFYYYGNIGLMEARSVSVVGSRKASGDGLKRAAKLGRELAREGIAVVSGLARGVDTAAMTAAIDAGGHTIGVIGTPLDECYPKENRVLQSAVARDHLLISQVPFYKYSKQPFNTRRYYFPERNELMAAISDGTVIVEASDTSGTLTQARACLHQGRKLFILKSCYNDHSITWPRKYADKENVYVVESTSDIVEVLYDGN